MKLYCCICICSCRVVEVVVVVIVVVVAVVGVVAVAVVAVPNSESVGFQSLGRGAGDTKMHAPKNRNSPGILLESFAVGLQSWANVV